MPSLINQMDNRPPHPHKIFVICVLSKHEVESDTYLGRLYV